MNTRGNSNQPSSTTGSPIRQGTARKSTATRKIVPPNGNTSAGSTSAASNPQTASPRTARKSTSARKTIPVDDNTSPDSTSSASNSPKASPKTRKRSAGAPKTNPVDNNAVPDSTTNSPREARKSTATRVIASVKSNASIKHSTRSSKQTSLQILSQSRPSTSQSSPTSSKLSQPGCSWHGTQSSTSASASKKKTKSRRYSEDSTDEEFSSINLDNLVNKCVKYFLVADQKKYAIKKPDIIKNVFENQDIKLYKTVIDKACQILKKTFGLEILNIEDRKNEYLLINIIDRDLGTRDFAEYSPSELQKQGLVFYLLTLIYMNENVIVEDQLWKALEPLGIDINSRIPHPIFGDVKKYITVELVKQMYLEYRCICKDPIQYEFVWGQRAKQEVGKEDLLEFACKVMGDTRPQDWLYQYNDAMSKDSPEE